MARIPKQERSSYKTLRALHWTDSDIARKFGRDRHSVALWLERTEDDGGDDAVLDHKGRGRKRKTSQVQDEQLAEEYKARWRSKGFGRRLIEKDLQECPLADMPTVSGQTVYNRLNESAGNLKAVPRKFVLTDDHKAKRRKWGEQMRSENFGVWIFSDETQFKVGDRKRKVFQFPGEKVEDIKYQQPIRQSVWSCMSAEGVGDMEFIDGPLTAEKFKDILQRKLVPAAKKLFPAGSFKFQMDNDPKHKAAVVSSWLEEAGITVADWPASSPDMNPIENLHRIWKERVNSYHPTSHQDLRNSIEKVFRDMTANDTRPLVDGMPRRVKALRSAKGGHTKY
jgi:hypothetical protein